MISRQTPSRGKSIKSCSSTSFLPFQGAIGKRYQIPRVSLRSALGSALAALSGRRVHTAFSLSNPIAVCQNSFVSLRARPAIPYSLDSHDRMRCRVKPGKTRRERLHHFDTPTFFYISITYNKPNYCRYCRYCSKIYIFFQHLYDNPLLVYCASEKRRLMP